MASSAKREETVNHYFCVLEEIQEGCQVWRDKDGLPHRMDGPAIVNIHKDVIVRWKLKDQGEIRGMGGPLVGWYFHGKPHRIGGPSQMWKTEDDGPKKWYVNGYPFWPNEPNSTDKEKENYEAACIKFCEEHDIITPGRATKRATPN